MFVAVGDAIELADPATAAGIEPAWYSGEILSSAIQSQSKIDIKKYHSDLLKFLVANNYSSNGQQIIASITRNPQIFHLIFTLLPNYFIKHLLKTQ